MGSLIWHNVSDGVEGARTAVCLDPSYIAKFTWVCEISHLRCTLFALLHDVTVIVLP